MPRITLAIEKHKLVHVTTYATIEPPRPKKKGVFYVHCACGKKIARGAYKTLGSRSRRVPSCIRCIRWPEYPKH